MLYCPSCMGENEDRALRCRRCGGDMSLQNQPHQLPVMTILRGRYLVGRVLGQGGFGITYLGLDLVLGMKVAVKEYYPRDMVDRVSARSLEVRPRDAQMAKLMEKGRIRFYQEAQAMAKFYSEPHIVNVTDFFYDNATAYIVMEHIEGESLEEWLKKHGPEKDFDKVYTMLVPVMEALKKVHGTGMVHRDVSPANIMLDTEGQLKLIDFGTARDVSPEGSDTLSVMLKHGYAPMEQYSTHGKQGPWTDVYALCATMYKLSTGRTPPNATDLVLKFDMDLPSTLGVKISPAQERALIKGMAPKILDRIQNIDGLMQAMKDTTAGPEARWKRPIERPRELRLPPWSKWAATALVALLIGLGIGQAGGGDGIEPAAVQETVAASTPQPTSVPWPSSTPQPILTPRPTSTPAPTPVPTPMPDFSVYGYPSDADLDAVDTKAEHPDSESYLSEYAYATIDAPKGEGVYGIKNSDKNDGLQVVSTIEHGARVAVLAHEHYRYFVIDLETLRSGWVNDEYVILE